MKRHPTPAILEKRAIRHERLGGERVASIGLIIAGPVIPVLEPTGRPGRLVRSKNKIKPSPIEGVQVVQILAIMRTSGPWLAEGKEASLRQLIQTWPMNNQPD